MELNILKINEELNEMKRKYDELSQGLEDIITGTQYNTGYFLCAYGSIYKAIFYSSDFQNCLAKLTELRNKDLFDSDDMILCDYINKVKAIASRNNYSDSWQSIKEDLLSLIKQELINIALEQL